MTNSRGFTLIEMAIVLVIITILIGGLAMPLSAQIQARRIAETNKTLEEARDALIGYAMTHKTVLAPNNPYLPCPDTNGDGKEDRTGGKCNKQVGYLPWVTLGAGAQDAWGDRLLYATNTEFSDDNSGFNFSTPSSPTSSSWNQVCSTHTCTMGDVAANVPAVIVSMGPNGWGARNVNGNTLAAPAGADELENQVNKVNNIFVSRSPTQPGAPSGEFDDLVTWISTSVLIARVCPSGGCCPPTGC